MPKQILANRVNICEHTMILSKLKYIICYNKGRIIQFDDTEDILLF